VWDPEPISSRREKSFTFPGFETRRVCTDYATQAPTYSEHI